MIDKNYLGHIFLNYKFDKNHHCNINNYYICKNCNIIIYFLFEEKCNYKHYFIYRELGLVNKYDALKKLTLTCDESVIKNLLE